MTLTTAASSRGQTSFPQEERGRVSLERHSGTGGEPNSPVSSKDIQHSLLSDVLDVLRNQEVLPRIHIHIPDDLKDKITNICLKKDTTLKQKIQQVEDILKKPYAYVSREDAAIFNKEIQLATKFQRLKKNKPEPLLNKQEVFQAIALELIKPDGVTSLEYKEKYENIKNTYIVSKLFDGQCEEKIIKQASEYLLRHEPRKLQEFLLVAKNSLTFDQYNNVVNHLADEYEKYKVELTSGKKKSHLDTILSHHPAESFYSALPMIEIATSAKNKDQVVQFFEKLNPQKPFDMTAIMHTNFLDENAQNLPFFPKADESMFPIEKKSYNSKATLGLLVGLCKYNDVAEAVLEGIKNAPLQVLDDDEFKMLFCIAMPDDTFDGAMREHCNFKKDLYTTLAKSPTVAQVMLECLKNAGDMNKFLEIMGRGSDDIPFSINVIKELFRTPGNEENALNMMNRIGVFDDYTSSSPGSLYDIVACSSGNDVLCKKIQNFFCENNKTFSLKGFKSWHCDLLPDIKKVFGEFLPQEEVDLFNARQLNNGDDSAYESDYESDW